MMTESDAGHRLSSAAAADLMESALPRLASSSLPLPTSEEDLETFLSNVDQVTNLISKLATADTEAELDRLRDDADQFIAKFARATQKSTDGGTESCDVGGEEKCDGVPPSVASAIEYGSEELPPDPQAILKSERNGVDLDGATDVDDGNPWRELRMDEETLGSTNESRASDWREKGNKAFNTEDYELAYYCYSRGLDAKPDCTALWTNRAQALIKMQVYGDALSDCAVALALSPDCPKAYVHRGRALLALGRFDDAVDAFNEVRNFDPKFRKCVNSYLKQVEEARQKAVEHIGQRPPTEGAEGDVDREKNVRRTDDDSRTSADGADHDDPCPRGEAQREPVKIKRKTSSLRQRYSADVAATLQMLRVPNQQLDYYVSGLMILTMELVDITAATVFRTANGFDLLTSQHPVVYAALSKPCLEDLSPSELDLHDALFKVLAAVCDRNVENQRKCCAAEIMPGLILKFVSSPATTRSSPTRCKESALRLMYVLVNSELGRDAVVERFDAASLLSSLFSAAREGRSREGAASAVFATMVFTRLAPDKKFKVGMRERFAQLVLPSFEILIQSSFPPDDDDPANDGEELKSCEPASTDLLGAAVPSPEDVAVVPSSFAVMAVLATDRVLRSSLAGRLDLWTACLDLLDKSVTRLTAAASPAKFQSSKGACSLSVCNTVSSASSMSSRNGGDDDDDADRRYVHKLILHMLGFLINISQEDSPYRLRFAAAICAHCVQLLKLQEPKSLWHARSFLNSPSPSSSSDSAVDGAATADPSLSSTAHSLPKVNSSSASNGTDDCTVADPAESVASNFESHAHTSNAPNQQPSATTILPIPPLPKPATTSPSLLRKDCMPLEEEPHESTRALVLLSLLLPQSDKFVEDFVNANGIAPLISFIQYGTKNQVKASVKVTAVCAQQCPAARDDIVSCRKALASIVLLLKHDDEHVIGNAALCLTHCIEVPKVPEKLTKTNVVKHLLVLARDARKIGVQENCAILLAKLAMKENRHLQRLRELHGIEILHTCMKHIKT